jgi:hypothetical protein
MEVLLIQFEAEISRLIKLRLRRLHKHFSERERKNKKTRRKLNAIVKFPLGSGEMKPQQVSNFVLFSRSPLAWPGPGSIYCTFI